MTRPSTQSRALWLSRHILRHEPDLRAWLGSVVSGAAEVDDLVQETYAAIAGLASVDHIQDPRAYFFTVARSQMLLQLRRSRVVPIEAMVEVGELPAADTCSPERQASGFQELRRVTALLATLPARCRDAFLMRKVEGISQREIAARMGISENTVEKHIAKGLRLLMEGIGAEGAGATTRTRGREGMHEQRRRN